MPEGMVYFAYPGYMKSPGKVYHLYRDCPHISWTVPLTGEASEVKHWQQPCKTCAKRKEENHG